jgi:hypothetical protein
MIYNRFPGGGGGVMVRWCDGAMMDEVYQFI